MAKAAGLGRNAAQKFTVPQLGIARGVAQRVGAEPYRRPGSEFGKVAAFKRPYMEAARESARQLEAMGIPYAMWSIDEPRERPNPWNRKMEHTNIYADWLREAGVKSLMVTVMGDLNDGLDYTPLVDHHDIVAVHAGKGSEQLKRKTLAHPDKELWLYNTGMDRRSWGFYNYRVRSSGRWEWHFYFNICLDMEEESAPKRKTVSGCVKPETAGLE